MSEKEIVIAFFIEGYVKKNYEYVLKILSEDYIDHSPASARSNHDAVNILKIIANIFDNLKIEILDVLQKMNRWQREFGTMLNILASIWELVQHIKQSALKYWKTLKLLMVKLLNRGGIGLIKRLKFYY